MMEDNSNCLLPCSICGRTFKPESLEKHYKACERNTTKKRKVFDSTMQRIQGTDLVEFLPNILDSKKSEIISVDQQPDKIIEYSKPEKRKTTEIKVKSGVSPTSSKSPDNYEQCPHCERSFCLKAFDRHVEWCKEHKAPVALCPDTLKAKEMLNARLNYQAPKHGKGKKTQPCERNGKHGSNNAAKNSSYCCTSEFIIEKNNDSIRYNAKNTRSRESASAPSCTMQHLNSSESVPSGFSQRVYNNTIETPKQFYNLPEHFCDNLKNMKIVNSEVIQHLTEAYNNMLCDSGIIERDTLKGSPLSKDCEIDVENQEYISSENVAVQSAMNTNGIGQNQLLCITDLCQVRDAGSESSLSVNEEKTSLSSWSGRKASIDNPNGIRKAKFCFECGAKFPLELAKFCCECGEQRLIVKGFSHANT